VKLDKLLERNQLLSGQQPAVGELIYLKTKRDNAPKLVSIDTLKVKSKVDTIIIDIAEPKPLDTTFDNKVYDNIQQNIETSKTVETVTSLDNIQDFKENLSFFHTVQRGETLYSIGKKYGIRVDAVMYLNLLISDAIEAGQRLIINPAISNADTKEPQSTPGVHIVRQGETLFKIAKMYKLSIQDIKATNNLENEVVFIGQRLVIVKQTKK
jgi:LysM repeat protein